MNTVKEHIGVIVNTKISIIVRPWTYPFFEDIYPIPYHGQKSDIISYPLSRKKRIGSYPLKLFLPASQDAGYRITL
jgi:hypothetical protein